MSQFEQQEAFQRDLNMLVDRYGSEFDMTYASIVGVLELQKLEIASYLFNSTDSDDDDDEDDYGLNYERAL